MALSLLPHSLSLNTPGPSAKAITRKPPSNMILPKLFYKAHSASPLQRADYVFLKHRDLCFTLIVIQKRERLKDYTSALQREQQFEVERNRLLFKPAISTLKCNPDTKIIHEKSMYCIFPMRSAHLTQPPMGRSGPVSRCTGKLYYS